MDKKSTTGTTYGSRTDRIKKNKTTSLILQGTAAGALLICGLLYSIYATGASSEGEKQPADKGGLVAVDGGSAAASKSDKAASDTQSGGVHALQGPPPAKEVRAESSKTAASPKKAAVVAKPAGSGSGGKASSKPASQTTKSYVIQKGDTLSSISMKFYRSKKYVALLAEKNDILFINEMNVGETIKIPALTSAAAGSATEQRQDIDYSKVKLPATYLVRVGDTLFTIAMRFYQSQDYVELIAKHNKLATTADLKAGTDLVIPAIPNATKIIVSKHIIADGETLSSISRKYYGSSKYAASIAKYNRLSDNDVVKSGDVLSIPQTPSV
ncbi:LysM peptidoglycan-binding domain-containing protein [Paenibacillus silvisoli]|uniref:LysM peptidoglycan-binding domain-containing protein n=1 Tax=Paenibacillus silvisoli TaxID=3110539 RepID=UPI002803D48D|nr:LysM domain-containing protein [Paenibacillus silvisoli]